MSRPTRRVTRQVASRLLSTKAVLRAGACLAATTAGAIAVRFGAWMSPDQVIVFVAVPVACGALLLAASFAGEEARRNVLLALASLSFALYGAEIALLYWSSVPLQQRVARDDGSEWTAASRTALLERLRATGIRAYPIVSANELIRVRLGPDSLQPLAPSVSGSHALLCDELGLPVAYDADEHGFNNPVGVWTQERVPLVMLGDSYAHGVCVEPGSSLAGRLRASWPGLVNLGVSGSGPLFQLALLREYVAPLRPESIVWFYYEGNDLYDLSLEESDELLPRYLDPAFSQRSMARQGELDGLLAGRLDSLLANVGTEVGIWSARRRPTPWNVIRAGIRLDVLRRMAGVGVPIPTRESALRGLPAILTEAHDAVASWGGRLVFVYIPSYLRFHSWIGESTRGRAEILDLTRRLGIETIDLVPAFETTEDPRAYWAHPDAHLSPEGYAFVAEVVAETLRGGSPR